MLYHRLGAILEESLCIPIPRDLPGQTLLRQLLSSGSVSPADISHALQRKLGIGFWEPEGAPLARELGSLLPQALARQYRMVPVRAEADGVYLAMADPLDLSAADAAALCIRRRILPMLALPDSVDRAISDLYGSASAAQALRDLRSSSEPAAPPAEESTDRDAAPTIRLVAGFLEYAVSQNASDIHLEPREEELAVRMRIDGQLRQVFTVPKENQAAVIARVKVMGDLDVSEHRIPQDGRTRFRAPGMDLDLRISTLPTILGEKAVIRLLHQSSGLLTPEGIGLAGDAQPTYQRLLEAGSGVILIAGPTGAGKSATMYTMIRELNRDWVNLITLEDPVEYRLPGVNQVPIREKTGMTFASALRAVLRQDPDIIAVGEIRDPETADIAMRAAITGHLVLSTVHCADAPGTVDRLLDMGIAPYLISAAVRGILAQRLVRKICPGCREAYHPHREEQQQLGLPYRPDRILYRGRGCPRCFHSGFRGRTGVFEILHLTPALRRAISAGATREELRMLIGQSGFRSMHHDCIRLLEAGITATAEVLQVLRSLQDQEEL